MFYKFADLNAKHQLIIFAIIIILLFSLCCLGYASQSEASAHTAVEAYLTEFFTWNSNGRIDAMLSSPEEFIEPETALVFLEETYSSLFSNSTAEWKEQLIANRLPFKYDQQCTEAGLTAEIAELEISAVDEHSFNYTITYQSEELNSFMKAPLSGKVYITIQNGRVLIDRITNI